MKIVPKQFAVLGVLTVLALVVAYDVYDRQQSIQQFKRLEAEGAADVARLKSEIKRLQDELDELKK